MKGQVVGGYTLRGYITIALYIGSAAVVFVVVLYIDLSTFTFQELNFCFNRVAYTNIPQQYLSTYAICFQWDRNNFMEQMQV